MKRPPVDSLEGAILAAPRVPAQAIVLGGDARLWLREGWLAAELAGAVLERLRREVPWEQKAIRLFGRSILQPRLVAWVGDPEALYTYSGLTLDPHPWTPILSALRARASADAGVDYNSVLLNLYRDGNDSMGLHADDERELGPEPVIASLSLGAVRRFVLRPTTPGGERRDLDLPAGSLLVMSAEVQRRYRHGVPKQPAISGARINLTFRRIVPSLASR